MPIQDSRHTEEYLCAQNVLIAWPGELLESLAHLDLALAIGVDLSSVEEVDARILARIVSITARVHVFLVVLLLPMQPPCSLSQHCLSEYLHRSTILQETRPRP